MKTRHHRLQLHALTKLPLHRDLTTWAFFLLSYQNQIHWAKRSAGSDKDREGGWTEVASVDKGEWVISECDTNSHNSISNRKQ